MRKVFSQLALAAAALVGVSTSANAYVVLTLADTQNGITLTCNSLTPGLCDPRFNVVNSNNIQFNGTIGDYTVSTTSGTGNTPGNAVFGQINTSTTEVTRVTDLGAANTLGGLYIDLAGFTFLLPSGGFKTLEGAASYTSFVRGAGDAMNTTFTADPLNAGALSNPISCAMNITLSNESCGTGAIVWNDTTDGAFPGYSLRSQQVFSLNVGSLVNTTSSLITFNVPEPMTTSLVGAALLGLALTSRRRGSKQA